MLGKSFAAATMKLKILPGLTTTRNSDWKSKIKEIDELKIKEVAFFATGLEPKERKKLYSLLEKTGLKRIPFVHARDDFQEWEFEYFIKKFKTKVFNSHFDRLNERFLQDSFKYRKFIYLENNWNFCDEMLKWFKIFPGFCLDISHLENYTVIQKAPDQKNLPKYLRKYKIGCAHISAVKKKPFWEIDEGIKRNIYVSHFMKDLSDFDYVKKYKDFLPRFCAIELENSFAEQLKAKEYLEKILFD
ncbi:MAG: hypothetical protein WC582_03280 [Patescibacteria group bacterium]